MNNAPAAAVAAKNANLPATDKQVALVSKLAREIHGNAGGSYLVSVADVLKSRSETSELIDGLMASAKAKRAEVAAKRPAVNLDEIVAGFYAVGDDVYRVKPGKRYAEKLVFAAEGAGKGHFDYDKGAIYRLAGVSPMTREEAAEMGRGMNHCIRCGAYLEVKESVERGMGPWCWKQAW